MAFDNIEDRAAVTGDYYPGQIFADPFDRAAVASDYWPGGTSGVPGDQVSVNTVMNLGGIAVWETVSLTAEAKQTIALNSDVWGS